MRTDDLVLVRHGKPFRSDALDGDSVETDGFRRRFVLQAIVAFFRIGEGPGPPRGIGGRNRPFCQSEKPPNGVILRSCSLESGNRMQLSSHSATGLFYSCFASFFETGPGPYRAPIVRHCFTNRISRMKPSPRDLSRTIWSPLPIRDIVFGRYLFRPPWIIDAAVHRPRDDISNDPHAARPVVQIDPEGENAATGIRRRASVRQPTESEIRLKRITFPLSALSRPRVSIAPASWVSRLVLRMSLNSTMFPCEQGRFVEALQGYPVTGGTSVIRLWAMTLSLPVVA